MIRCVSRASTLLLTATALLLVPDRVQGQDDSTRIRQLERQIEAITRQLEALSLGADVVAEADSSVLGFGPGASKIYRASRGVSIGGYGEVLYERFDAEREDGTPSGARDQLDALRAIVYVGYKFNDRILFNSEIEVEHGSTDQAGSVSLEFAYLDYRLSESFGVRGGMLLVPMGFVNELHEPPTFLATERPLTENRIIPTTWRENGIGVFGDLGPFSYRVYVVNSLDGVGGGPSDAGGFSAAGLRGGRQKGSRALAENLAGVARVDYQRAGLRVGTSVYTGRTGQGAPQSTNPGATIDGGLFLWEGHAEYRAHGFQARGLVALADLDQVVLLNQARGLTGNESIGERMLGWYLEGGYDVLRSTRSEHQLIPFVRYERVNTQDRVPAGFSADPATDRDLVVAGLHWKPIAQVAVKADYQIHGTAARTGVNQFNVALGYLF